MQRPVSLRPQSASGFHWRKSAFCPSRHGFTLVEILVTTTLALLLLMAVTKMIGTVGESVAESRAMLEMADRLRLAQVRLQMDLAGVTVTMVPPRDPANNEGYFEYIEGPVGTTPGMILPSTVAKNTDNSNNDDTTVGDFDDILIFTTRNAERPFTGKYGGGTTIQSDMAEVAWFVRGRTLHRRMLLVAPGATLSGAAAGFYQNYDISARWNGSRMVANTLSDLTRRECRFAHPTAYPCDVRLWCWTNSGCTFPTLPTLNECLSTEATGRTAILTSIPPILDFWTNARGVHNELTHCVPDNAFNGYTDGSRITDDIILTNVIGFDVKGWDPTALGGAGAYVDLGYSNAPYTPATANSLSHLGDPRSKLNGSATTARVYDTYSTSYEAGAAISSNGLDDNNNGIVDDDGEKTYAPPYPIPLRGIQVKIRVFEPDSRQIREVTVVQEFLPQ